MEWPKTTITVPVFDGPAQHPYTGMAVTYILEETTGDFALVVVDNASPDDATPRFLAEMAGLHPNLRVITNKRNRGYGPALNQGMRLGYENGSEFFVCLNNDIAFRTPTWLEDFIAPLQKNKRQLIGARLIDLNTYTDFGDGPVHYLEGWAIAWNRCFLEEGGYFDERIHLWFEDVEVCIRARKMGFAVIQSPEFEWQENRGLPRKGGFIHFYGQTGFRSGMDFPRISAESREIVRRKHFG